MSRKHLGDAAYINDMIHTARREEEFDFIHYMVSSSAVLCARDGIVK